MKNTHKKDNTFSTYYAVIFTSIRTDVEEGYAEMAEQMVNLAKHQKGFLGVESARSSDGSGITISYWQTMDDILHWKEHSVHQIAQTKGRDQWYKYYKTRICKVEREYEFEKGD